ncbi:DMT family transporter [Melaminivora alkalimesophila]|uniref:Threonine/homoserine efflux transporter RhtA n=1 Tax=Melaminivora alkalimesophila TaxID=1165852 RepID=A0A317RFC6_9BURK|nr:DMT family transporter [Melaminivora alkalimesophila]PWW48914.1 threonine/homoserine efflux transporter RhtA [Melaminivora alkalimesophila]
MSTAALPTGAPAGLTHGRAVWLMATAALMWSIAGVVTRHLEQARSFEITFWRSFFMLLSLCVMLPLLRGRTAFAPLLRGGVPLWLSGVCWSVMFTAFMVGITLMPVANVLVTMAAGPLLTALVARVFIGHRIAPRTWGAIAMAGVGIVWMYGSEVANLSPVGLAVALCIPVAAAVNWTVVQSGQRQGQSVDLVPAVFVGAALSSLATLPWALPFVASARDIGLLALLGLVQLAIPCVLVVYCGRVLKAPEIALLGLLEVIFGILLAWVGAGERPAPAVLMGGTLVIAALVFNELLAWKEQGT